MPWKRSIWMMVGRNFQGLCHYLGMNDDSLMKRSDGLLMQKLKEFVLRGDYIISRQELADELAKIYRFYDRLWFCNVRLYENYSILREFIRDAGERRWQATERRWRQHRQNGNFNHGDAEHDFNNGDIDGDDEDDDFSCENENDSDANDNMNSEVDEAEVRYCEFAKPQTSLMVRQQMYSREHNVEIKERMEAFFNSNNLPYTPLELKTCIICLDGIEKRHLVVTRCCLHTNHQACLDKWLSNHTTCPMCRTVIV